MAAKGEFKNCVRLNFFSSSAEEKGCRQKMTGLEETYHSLKFPLTDTGGTSDCMLGDWFIPQFFRMCKAGPTETYIYIFGVGIEFS